MAIDVPFPGDRPRRHLLLTSLASLCLLAAAGSARACINDSEVDRSEREFKSQYNTSPLRGEPAPEYTPPVADSKGPLVWLAGGSLLFVGACVLCFRRPAGRS
jgi:hypothetical protein